MSPRKYNSRPVDVASDPEDLAAVAARLDSLLKPMRETKEEQVSLLPRPPHHPGKSYCKFCDRELTPEFSYVASNPKSQEQLCKRLDCKKKRENKSIDPLLLNPDIDTEAKDIEATSEGDTGADAEQIVEEFVNPQEPKIKLAPREVKVEISEQSDEEKQTESEVELPEREEYIAPKRAPIRHKLEGEPVYDAKSDQQRLHELLARPGLVDESLSPPSPCCRSKPRPDDLEEKKEIARRTDREFFGLSRISNNPYRRPTESTVKAKLTGELDIIKREADELVRKRLEKEEKARRRKKEGCRVRLSKVLERRNHTLRGAYQLSVRQTAALISKLKPCPLTREEEFFYRDLAANNLKKEKLQAKHSTWSREDVYLIETRIINRAVQNGLLEPMIPGEGPNFGDIDHPEEQALIVKTGGATLGGRIHGGRLSYRKDGSWYRKLESFDTAPTFMGKGSKKETDNRGPEHDDFGDESSA